jgi:hypothetical protein
VVPPADRHSVGVWDDKLRCVRGAHSNRRGSPCLVPLPIDEEAVAVEIKAWIDGNPDIDLCVCPARGGQLHCLLGGPPVRRMMQDTSD